MEKVFVDMKNVDTSPGFKWMLDEFVEAMNQQKVFEHVHIAHFRDGRLVVFFYTDQENHEGWYITGSPIICVVGSN